jgi:hypothetical protein
MAVRAAKEYRINLVRNLRASERKQESQRRLQAMAGLACFAVLALALAYSGMTIWKMEGVLTSEAEKLAQVQAEYRKYTATRTIVDKGDVELLSSLQGRGIFWTRKLAALATHLPENYAITSFNYNNGELIVTGHGFVGGSQDQLLVIDAYLNRLRADSAFSDVFRQLHLNAAQRRSDAGQDRVTFQFSAIDPEGQRK